jgi:hypothetical protein
LEFLQLAMSSFITIVVLVTLGAGVMKVFEIAKELGEIKLVLQEIRRSGQPLLVPRHPGAQTVSMGETESRVNLLRALSAEEYAAALQPEIVENKKALPNP